MSEIEIRPFCDQDREPITAFQNQGKPPHLHETVAEWIRSDARRLPDEVRLRLCVGAPAVAYMGIRDLGTTAYRKEGVCGLGLWVAPEQQGQGIGGALYDRAIAFAHERGAKRITTYFRIFQPQEPALRFFDKRGFTEMDRDVPSILHLTDFDPARFERPTPPGIQYLSYADAGDTDENRRRLYALFCTLEQDIPTNDAQRPEDPPFERFIQDFDTPEWDSNALFLAKNAAGDWIGVSQLGFQENTNIGWTFLTGVLGDYRGQGIALALKLHAIQAAKRRGCTLITTENHEDNGPMRAINIKLGFTPDAPGVSYNKDLSIGDDT